MKKFIKWYLGSIFYDFELDIKKNTLCHLKDLHFQGQTPNYNIKTIQQLYLLRYFPAYLCEYKYLYNKVINDKKLESYNVLSIGCGSYTDYYALYLALLENHQNITYTGIDTIDWNYKNSLGNSKINFIQSNLKDVVLNKNTEYNIIFFPKSISEIPHKELEAFMGKLNSTNIVSNNMYVISSAMDKGFSYDQDKYTNILEALKRSGFSCKNYQPTKEVEKSSFFSFDRDFIHPQEIIDFLTELDNNCTERKACVQNCTSQLNKTPILNTTYISYQINLLERK